MEKDPIRNDQHEFHAYVPTKGMILPDWATPYVRDMPGLATGPVVPISVLKEVLRSNGHLAQEDHSNGNVNGHKSEARDALSRDISMQPGVPYNLNGGNGNRHQR